MKRTKTKPTQKKLFFFTVPIYEREICVIVGMNHDEAVAAAKEQKCSKNFIEAMNWEGAKEKCDEVADLKHGAQGAAVRVNDDNYFIFLKPYKNDWKYLDTLNHECFHLTQFMGKILDIWNEKEPPAYMHSWMFKRLRRILSGMEK